MNHFRKAFDWCFNGIVNFGATILGIIVCICLLVGYTIIGGIFFILTIIVFIPVMYLAALASRFTDVEYTGDIRAVQGIIMFAFLEGYREIFHLPFIVIRTVDVMPSNISELLRFYLTLIKRFWFIYIITLVIVSFSFALTITFIYKPCEPAMTEFIEEHLPMLAINRQKENASNSSDSLIKAHAIEIDSINSIHKHEVDSMARLLNRGKDNTPMRTKNKL